MRNEFTAVIERDGEWYVAWSPEIPGANGQGRETARAFLKENKDVYAKIDGELRKRLSIGAVKADVPEVPVGGEAQAKELVKGRRG